MQQLTSMTIKVILISLVSCTIASAQAGKWATLKGQFIFGNKAAKIPMMAKLTPTKDQEVCGKNQLFKEDLIVNKENHGIANIVVWVYKFKGKTHADYKKSAKDTISIDNIGCRFEPHTVAVRVGQKFEVKNSDPISHNSMITFFKNDPVNPLIPAKGKVDIPLTKTELLPIKVQCSIHPWMEGIVLVQDHPYMAVTDKDGKFEIKNLPVGKHTVKVWHDFDGGRYIQDVKIDNKKTTWKRGKYALNIKKDEEHTYEISPKFFTAK